MTDRNVIKPWIMAAEELIVRYDAGERNFAGVELISDQQPYIDLVELDLRGINLRGATLRNADFTRANLTGADLTGAFLNCAKFDNAIVRDASLFAATINEVRFWESDLKGTCLSYVNASNAVFCKAKLDGGFEYCILDCANFRDAIISPKMICRGGNLIWETIMPDGSIVHGPQYGDGDGR